MNLDKTLTNLKKLHEGYLADVARLTAEVQAATEELNEAKNLMVQTEEAILALEGKSPVRKLLEEALKQPKMEPLNSAVGAIDAPATPTSPEGLPPAEPGTKWTKVIDPETKLEVNALVPIITQTCATSLWTGRTNETIAQTNITLPTVEDEKFEDPTKDLF